MWFRLAIALPICACGRATSDPSGTESKVEVVEQRAIAAVGAVNVLVRLRDAAGKPLAGYEVQARMESADAAVEPPSARSDGQGVARFSVSASRPGVFAF